jgi:carbon-monoxide dehydrogenase small subunit
MREYRGWTEITLTINGKPRKAVVKPAETLLKVLRERLGLQGSKLGCENGDCGACTVLADSIPVKSCMILAVECEEIELTTIEGLEETPTQQAFLQEAGFQCGFCTPGFILNMHSLLQHHPQPDAQTARAWLESNICRCTGYENIERALHRAAGNGGG